VKARTDYGVPLLRGDGDLFGTLRGLESATMVRLLGRMLTNAHLPA
jgi:hypothetical protein